MEIKRATFKCSSQQLSQIPRDTLPDIAFIGRSNVGKSSLINLLTGHGSLAKVSGTPGKTRLINHFLIDEMAAANLVLANQVTQLQNRPPEIKVIEKEVVRPVETKNVEIVESIPSTIPFKFNSAVVQDIYDPLIYNIGTFMKNNPDVKIRIVGYADKFGPINVNLRISQERAEAVANMLKKDYGINSNRMVIEYVGKEKPYYKNNNKWNRCAMVEIIK